MTSLHRIGMPLETSHSAGDRPTVDSQNYLAPDSISDALLTELLHNGAKVPSTSALPTLPPATEVHAADKSDELVAIPSMGAAMMEAIVGLASLMRRQNAELRAQQVNAMAAEMENQAKSMEHKASDMLRTGMIAGALNIVAGAASIGFGLKMSTHLGSALESEFSAINQRLNALSMGTSTSLGAAGSMTQSVGQSLAADQDAVIKYSEATVERSRANVEFMKSLEDSMREVINKAIATQDAIQQNTNQTRSKILG